MFHRRDYMNGLIDHHTYYASIAERASLARPSACTCPNMGQVLHCLWLGDDSLSLIPISVWDSAAHWCSELIDAACPPDETISQATRVCVMKSWARECALSGSTEEERAVHRPIM